MQNLILLLILFVIIIFIPITITKAIFYILEKKQSDNYKIISKTDSLDKLSGFKENEDIIEFTISLSDYKVQNFLLVLFTINIFIISSGYYNIFNLYFLPLTLFLFLMFRYIKSKLKLDLKTKTYEIKTSSIIRKSGSFNDFCKLSVSNYLIYLNIKNYERILLGQFSNVETAFIAAEKIVDKINLDIFSKEFVFDKNINLLNNSNYIPKNISNSDNKNYSIEDNNDFIRINNFFQQDLLSSLKFIVFFQTSIFFFLLINDLSNTYKLGFFSANNINQTIIIIFLFLALIFCFFIFIKSKLLNKSITFKIFEETYILEYGLFNLRKKNGKISSLNFSIYDSEFLVKENENTIFSFNISNDMSIISYEICNRLNIKLK